MSDRDSQSCDMYADLLGVYALDAVDPDEALAVSEHLRTCPRCAQEVAQHHETMVMLAGGGGPAPEGLWERISSSINTDAPSAPPPPRLAPGVTRLKRRFQPIRIAAVAAAVVLVVAVGLQSARINHLSRQVHQLSVASGTIGSLAGAQAALGDPLARHYSLTSTDVTRRHLGEIVVLPSGSSYLVGSILPALSDGRTYQLWSMVGGRAISVGVLGAQPRTVGFAVDTASGAGTFLVTVEPAGGVVTPTTAPVAQATV